MDVVQCISCSGRVSSRMHAICCDSCERWQHRVCRNGSTTGISVAQYKAMVRGTLHIDWMCDQCSSDYQNSTVIDEVIPEREDTTSLIRTMEVSLPDGSGDTTDQHQHTDIQNSTVLTEYVRLPDRRLTASPIRPLEIAETDRADGTDSNQRFDDLTFNIQDRRFNRPITPLDQSLPDRELDGEIPCEAPITYSIGIHNHNHFGLVVGWHRRINTRAARADLGLYVLIPLLKGESENVDLQVRLVSDHLVTRTHRLRYKNVHGRLFDAWDRYEDDEISTSKLLRICSTISGLAPDQSRDPIHSEIE